MAMKKTTARTHTRDPAVHSLHRIAEAVEHIAEHIHDWARDRGNVLSPEEREEIADALRSAKTASDSTQQKLLSIIAPTTKSPETPHAHQ